MTRELRELERKHNELIAETLDNLSSEGRAAFPHVLELEEQQAPVEMVGYYIEERFDPEECGLVFGYFRAAVELYSEALEQHTSLAYLEKQIAAVLAKAKEFEPDSVSPDTTAGEALTILERHGVIPGFPEEVLEMEVEIPEGE